MDKEAIMYMVLCFLVLLGVLIALPSFGPGVFSIVIVIFTLLAVVTIVTINWADFIVFPLVAGLLGITFQPARNYKIVKT